MTITRPTTYRIQVRGHLDDCWSDWFDGLSMTRNEDGTTTLSGPIADQAQLHGVLSRLRDIGVDLLGVNIGQRPARR